MNFRANSLSFHRGIDGPGYFDLSCYSVIFLPFDSMGFAVLGSSLLSGKAP